MTKTLWCRALPRLSLACALLEGCGDDGDASGADTAATTGGAMETGEPSTSGATMPDPESTSAPEPDDTTAADDDAATAGTTAATGDDGADTSSEGDGTSTTGGDALEIVGEWLEVFPGGGGMQTHTITEESWAIASEFGDSLHHIESWDSRARLLVAQSDAANAFNPELWGKFEWVFVDDALYYCQSVYDAETPEDAWAAPGADPGDLEAGCGGFPWSPLEPA
jgi:hypothetical protein